MIEGFLIASDASGNILPVTAVLAHDQEMVAASFTGWTAGLREDLPLNPAS